MNLKMTARAAKLLLAIVVSLFTSASIHAQSIFIGSGGRTIPPDVESVYSKGLAFLAKTQSKSGTWEGTHGSDAGVIGLAVVAMLAHGDDPNYGPYRDHIKRGIDQILKQQNSDNGYIGSSMYNHGFATLALAESYGAVDDKRIGPALKKAVQLILTSQAKNPHGAWRYSPETSSADTTVSGAILVALLASANAGVKVPNEAMRKALNYYKVCQSDDGGFGYSSRGGSNMPRTAIGVLVYALAKKKDTTVYKRSFSYLKGGNFESNNYYFYFLYYGSQAFFHSETKYWNQWNQLNIKRLKASQSTDGSWNGQFGKAFSTSAALLSLALNYRFLPIYER